MGLFDKLIKDSVKAVNDIVKDVATEENKEKAKNLFSSLKENISEGIETVKNDVLTEENKEKAKNLFSSLKENLGDGVEALKEATREAREKKETVTADPEKEQEKYQEVDDGLTCQERIVRILHEEFPEYTVQQNVSPREFGGTGRFMDYSIVVYDGIAVKLIIMVIGKTTASHREYRWSREFAEANGYPLINFIRHYPNNPIYISERLHKYL